MFSSRVWNYLQIPWKPGETTKVMIAAKKGFKGPYFFEVVILAYWCIWKQRNDWIFKGFKPSFRGWKASFCFEVTLLKHRVKPSNVDSLSA
jgi:hypothetical protein